MIAHRSSDSPGVAGSIAGPIPDGASASANRLEIHNVSVDEDLAGAGACGQIHLATGHACTLRHHHHGSCNIVDAAQLLR